MKKIFAVLAVYTVLASGIYAEINIAGSVGGGATLLKGSNVRTDVLQTGSYLAGSIEAEGVDEADSFGGSVKINAEASTTDPAAWAWSASVWWKPVYFIKLQLGYIDDFALTEIVGWGYHANDAETFVVSPKNNYAGDYFSDTTGFYSGTGNGWTGFTFSATPIYGLDINIAVPFGKDKEVKDPITGIITQKVKAVNTYMYTSAQIAYTLWGLGRLAFSYAGAGDGKLTFLRDEENKIETVGGRPYDPLTDSLQLYRVKSQAHSIYGSFLLTAFEDRGFSANLGFAYTMPAKYGDTTVTYNNPLEAGLGLSFGTDRMGIKARIGVSFMGSISRNDSDVLHEPLMLGLGLLPYTGFGPFMFYLNAGISYKWPDEYMIQTANIYEPGYGKVVEMGNSTALGWYLNPYMTVTIGSGRFYAGIQVESDGLKYVGTDKQNISSIRDGLDYYPGQTIIEWGATVGILFEF